MCTRVSQRIHKAHDAKQWINWLKQFEQANQVCLYSSDMLFPANYDTCSAKESVWNIMERACDEMCVCVCLCIDK